MPEATVRGSSTGFPSRPPLRTPRSAPHVLEHVEHDLESMAELHRVLAPTGQALIMVPVNRKLAETFEDPSITDPEARKQAFGHPGHVRYYGADVTARLEGPGFHVEPVDYVDRLPPGEAERISVPWVNSSTSAEPEPGLARTGAARRKGGIAVSAHRNRLDDSS